MEERELLQPELSDETLVARVARRDVAAFTILYDRYAGPVYTLAAHMLGRSEAEEIVQATFLRLWNKAEQFDAARGAFGAWFMTIARHHALDELRRRGQRQRLVAAEGIDRVLTEVTDPAPDVEEQAWLRERGDAVLRALNDLPDEQRRVLVLAYFGGLSQAAIAECLGLPLGTVKKRIRLGLQKLRAALLQQGPAAEAQAEPKRIGVE